MLNREEALGVLSQIPDMLRDLHRSNRALQEKLASYERTTRVGRVVATMEEKGLLDASERSEKEAQLQKMGMGELDALELVLPMAAPSVDIGKVATEVGMTNAPKDALNRWILNGEG